MKNIKAKLQTFAGAMMVPIILFVLVGFYVSIGSALSNYAFKNGFLHVLFSLFAQLGFMFMNNLEIWFAIGIAFTLAKKEKGWAAFAGIVFYFGFMTIVKSYAESQGWTEETVQVQALLQKGFTEQQALNFNALWGTPQGIFSYNMGIFSGILSGLCASFIHNKFVDTELPAMFGFFAGPKFVMILVTLAVIPFGIAVYYIWPFIARALQALTGFIASSGLFGTFLFGTADKMLLPFGIHHLIAFPIEYSSVGGSLQIDGVMYEGVRNIINGQAASPNVTGYIVRNFTTGRILFQLAGLPGAAYAMYKTALPENRKKVASLLIPAVLTLALVGISEPIEYTFLFVAPALYFLVYAPLAGLCYVVAEVAKISINGHALFFMIPNIFQPQKVHALPLLILLPLTFLVYYFVFKFVIQKFDLKTPGRDLASKGIKLMSKKEYRDLQAQKESTPADTKKDSLENNIIAALGGADNIETITACATRLRVTVKDPGLVADDDSWKNDLEAIGVVHNDRALQIIYGVRVQNILTRTKDILNLD
ncbi:MAG: PTS transporter subunit EIIC [Peptoniphilaceae bacterium]|nr:PTS transporter subunit EIIC [Peptoniphilaceae bacterium]MDY5841580.1 PTS transporter subunit EIIC [Peptoniphilaceae bacterium]MDY6146677.1 PTS transporter subunit EIIC [Peptoniphilaceae bacterium]